MSNEPDLFTNVHKGIRAAFFDACVALGRADPAGRALLADALHFAAHHGENEDLLLLPSVEARAGDACLRMRRAHEHLDAAIAALQAKVGDAPLAELYRDACTITARYLEHLREEEEELEPILRAAMSSAEIAAFGARSVARTAPSDQRMMLRRMFRAITPADVEGYLAKLPPELAAELVD